MGGHVGAADPSANLVELRQPELIRPLDDQSVRLRYVQARLDDRRRNEDIRVATEEGVHLLLQLPFAHLAMCDEEAETRRELLQLLQRLVDRLDAVVEVEGLAATLHLALEGELDRFLVVLADRRTDWAAALRRGLDDRDVAEPGERHVQRARNRRRTQRQ